MPNGLKRYYGHEYLHFLTCSCYHRQPWLVTPCRRDLFLQILEQVRQQYGFVVVGYVVMPEHIHLLIGEPERGTQSTVMQVLKQRYARRVLAEARAEDLDKVDSWESPPVAKCAKDRPPGVWQRRFYDFHVWSERKRVEKLRYMHRNPVKDALVQEPEQWMWSSYRSYAYGEEGMVRINQWRKAEWRFRPVA
jgi:putative transposase